MVVGKQENNRKMQRESRCSLNKDGNPKKRAEEVKNNGKQD